LIGGYIGYGETITLVQALLVGLAIAGVIFLAQGTREDSEGTEKKGIDWEGVLAGLGAAFTETLMYFAVRTASVPNPFHSTVELYSGALLGMMGLVLAGGSGALGATAKSWLRLENGFKNWSSMSLFNTFIGFAGYALRFYAIPKMSTLAFSMLSLVGVIASFIWGLLFVSEVPNWMSLLGSFCIVAAAMLTDKKE
jgi:drug/metabolite transporter (DMT)-like permease